MGINWIRYILTVVAAFVAYGVIYSVGLMVMPGGEAMAELARAEDDPAMVWTMTGHFVETLVLVFIFHMFVKTKDLKTGGIYGLAFGLYFAATTWSMTGSVAALPADNLMTYLPLHLLAGLIGAGIVPTLLYKPVEADEATE